MKRFALALALTTMLASPAFARQPKTYQVTGKVTELTDELIVLDKDGEGFEIGRSADTKVTGELKVGSKVTVQYRMSAAKIDNKDKK